jgi:competence protein ComEA
MVALAGIGINFLNKRFSRLRVIKYINQDIGRVDLNQADKVTLMGIPGIGQKIAQRIIDYRLSKGPFKDISELKNINGIGECKYEAIKDYFVIR